MITNLIIHPIVKPLYDQPLYNTQILRNGLSHITFFNSFEKDLPSNSHYGALHYPQHFTIKRIALSAAANSRSQDFYNALQGAIFKLDVGMMTAFDIPATNICLANLKEINSLLYSVRKLPAVQQEMILRNLKVAEGYLLENSLELVSQQNFRATITFSKPLILKHDVEITCLLGGLLKRSITY